MNLSERAGAMLEFFETHQWLKGVLVARKEGEVVAACLAGAELVTSSQNDTDWNWDLRVTPAVGQIALQEFPERFEFPEQFRATTGNDFVSAGVLFNNHSSTTMADLRHCLEKIAARETVDAE